jgi:hypothetical protein
VLFSGCHDKEDKSSPLANQTVYGKSIKIGEGTAYSWATFDEEGNPAAVGVCISEKAIKTILLHQV